MTQLTRIAMVFALLALATVAVVAVGCEQGHGERCQATDDCEPPLICNVATQTCATMSGGGIDATVPDASTDAPIDAPIDAPPDTM